jgi:eukaryotic-like serine/threonine-protein kinase
MIRRILRFIGASFAFVTLLLLFSIIAMGVAYYLFTVSVKRQTVEVPNVANMEINRAVEILVKEGLTLAPIQEEYDDIIAPGRIVKQRPQPGTVVKLGRTIELTKSAGSPMVVAPDLSDLTPREADLRLVERELEGGRLVYTYDNRAPEGKIITQNPRGGENALRGRAVNMLISMGARPIVRRMPNLVGMHYQDARRMLQEAGLRLESVESKIVSDATPGSIISHSPRDGEPVDSETPLVLEISAEVDSASGIGYQWHQFQLDPELGILAGITAEVTVMQKDSNGEQEILKTGFPKDGKLDIFFAPAGETTIRVYLDGNLIDQKFVETKAKP